VRIALLLSLLTAFVAQTVPEGVILEKDIEYSNVGGRVAMDVARPSSAGPFPAVVAIHGGGFRRGSRDSYLPLCQKLAQRGYVCATVSYRLSPRNQFPAPVHDVKAAVRFLRANALRFHLDPDRIGATGGSAGGHLALFLGLTGGVAGFEGSGPNLDQSSRVACVVNYFGPTDFTQSYGKSVDAAEVLPLFLGGDLEHAPLIHRRASPLNWVSPGSAPILTIHGTDDKYVAYEQGVWLTERLKAAGVDAELETLQGAGHGFKGADADRAEQRLIAYFDKHLKPKPSRRILVADHGPIGEVVAMEWPSGKELWKVPNQRGHDVQPLPNGHVLYTAGGWHQVIEIDERQRPVWNYSEGLDHPISAQRLSNGNTLIGDAKLGKVIEVDPAGAVVWKYESPDLANMRMRNSRRTAAGTTLIAIEAAGKIIEVSRAGEIVWAFEAPGGGKRLPYQAHRLASGNTLISMTDPGEVVEVDASGKIVRSVGGEKMDIRMGWASGTFPLPGGGFLVSDYTGRRLIEIDASGKVVHELRTGARTVASLALQ
jgi:acetyl esterase/lipase